MGTSNGFVKSELSLLSELYGTFVKSHHGMAILCMVYEEAFFELGLQSSVFERVEKLTGKSPCQKGYIE